MDDLALSNQFDPARQAITPAMQELLVVSDRLGTTRSDLLAGALYKSKCTVNDLWCRTFRVLNVHSRSRALAVARAAGIIPSDGTSVLACPGCPHE